MDWTRLGLTNYERTKQNNAKETHPDYWRWNAQQETGESTGVGACGRMMSMMMVVEMWSARRLKKKKLLLLLLFKKEKEKLQRRLVEMSDQQGQAVIRAEFLVSYY